MQVPDCFRGLLCVKEESLKVPPMQHFQTAASVLTHRLPISENLMVLIMEVNIMNSDLAIVRGVTFYFPDIKRNKELSDASLFASLRAMQESSAANTAVLAFPAWQATAHATSFDWQDQVPGDGTLTTLIRRAKEELGLRVFLKPMINVSNGDWRAYINFLGQGAKCEGTWEEWFESYGAYMLHFAELAERTGCELLYIGCEQVMSESREDDWRSLIAQIRQRYHGLLTYNTDKYREEWVTWWDAVDVISSSGYYPEGSWPENLKRIEPVVKKYDKPFFFAECGCPSRRGAGALPNDWTRMGEKDFEEQARYYRDMLSHMEAAPWVRGCAIWAWSTEDAFCSGDNDDYSFFDKPAAAVLKEMYEKW
jgi:hypothetical protein